MVRNSKTTIQSFIIKRKGCIKVKQMIKRTIFHDFIRKKGKENYQIVKAEGIARRKNCPNSLE